jgi:glycyl-tRNA synthetase beta chain
VPTDTLLVELGTEELPPKSLNKLRQAFAEECRQGLEKAGLGFSSIVSNATPRRMVLQVYDLIDQQPDQSIERRGPAMKAAFDDEGNPTKALSGFMKSCGIEDPDKLDKQETEKGTWLVFRATQAGQPLSALLTGILDEALARLPIDRRMRWGKHRAEFVRPVQWLVCLYGSEVMPVTLFGHESGRQSMGHRFMSQGPFSIANADDYIETCRTHCVMVDFAERQETIRSQITGIAATEKAQLDIDSALLEEVTSLVEWPVALMGSFEKEFLEVPAEVLISAMKEHQRYFHLTDPASGELLPRFITVSNIESSNPEAVVAGNERVIRPRLSDAAFFFSQDAKTTLADKTERLKQVVFQTDLGSYFDKITRISNLAGFIAGNLNEDTATAAPRISRV